MNGLSRKELLPDPKDIASLRQAVATKKSAPPKVKVPEADGYKITIPETWLQPLSISPHPMNVERNEWSSICPEDIRLGMKLFFVHALGEKSSFIDIGIVKKLPYLTAGSILFIDVDLLSEIGTYKFEWALEDGNCVPNNYNLHRMYDDEDKANRYLERCKRLNLRLLREGSAFL